MEVIIKGIESCKTLVDLPIWKVKLHDGPWLQPLTHPQFVRERIGVMSWNDHSRPILHVCLSQTIVEAQRGFLEEDLDEGFSRSCWGSLSSRLSDDEAWIELCYED